MVVGCFIKGKKGTRGGSKFTKREGVEDFLWQQNWQNRLKIGSPQEESDSVYKNVQMSENV